MTCEEAKVFGNIHSTCFIRLVHAITPLEENKSFLERVQLGGLLCGLDQSQLDVVNGLLEPSLITNSLGASLEPLPVTLSLLGGLSFQDDDDLSTSSEEDEIDLDLDLDLVTR